MDYNKLKSHYKKLAQEAVVNAKRELDSANEHRLKYAALELRAGLEALTYHRLLIYKDEVPPSEYAKWQPRKVLEMLLTIYPHADKHSVVSIGEVNGDSMRVLGHDRPVSISEIKEYYNALGSLLHTRTVSQVEKSGVKPNFDSMKKRCNEVLKILEDFLHSNVTLTLGNFSTLAKCYECGNPVRRRLVDGEDRVKVACFNFNCKAEYWLIRQEEGKTLWNPIHTTVSCHYCKYENIFWPKQVAERVTWKCGGCSREFEFQLGFVPLQESSSSPGGTRNRTVPVQTNQ